MINWDALGAIAELLGASAVFITLLFLATQVRQSNRVASENTRILKAEMKHRSNDSITRWCETLISNPELNRIWDDGRQLSQLTDIEKATFFRMARNYFGLHMTSYYDFDAVDDQPSKQRMVEYAVQELQSNEGLREVWTALKDTPFSSYREFCHEVDTALAKDDRA